VLSIKNIGVAILLMSSVAAVADESRINNSGFLISGNVSYMKGSAGGQSETDFPAFNFGIGYQFNDNVKLKIGRANLGSYSENETGCYGWYCWDFDNDLDVKSNYAMFQFLFGHSESSRFYMELGKHNWTITSRPPSGDSSSTDGNDLVFGFGMEKRYEKFEMLYGMRQWKIDSGNVKDVYLGASMTF